MLQGGRGGGGVAPGGRGVELSGELSSALSYPYGPWGLRNVGWRAVWGRHHGRRPGQKQHPVSEGLRLAHACVWSRWQGKFHLLVFPPCRGDGAAGQRPTESRGGRGRPQPSDIRGFDGLKGTEIPHRKGKRKRQGPVQTWGPWCLSVCWDRRMASFNPLWVTLWHGFSRY